MAPLLLLAKVLYAFFIVTFFSSPLFSFTIDDIVTFSISCSRSNHS